MAKGDAMTISARLLALADLALAAAGLTQSPVTNIDSANTGTITGRAVFDGVPVSRAVLNMSRNPGGVARAVRQLDAFGEGRTGPKRRERRLHSGTADGGRGLRARCASAGQGGDLLRDRKSTRLNSSHVEI